MDLERWLQGRERLFIVALLFLILLVAFFAPIRFPVEPSDATKAVHGTVANTPGHSIVLILYEGSPDFGGGLGHALETLLYDSFQHRHRVVLASLSGGGVEQAATHLEEVAASFESLEYGRTHVSLGNVGGGSSTLRELLEGIPQRVLNTVDARDRTLKEYQLVRDFYSLDAIALVGVFVSGDDAGREFFGEVRQIVEPKRIPLVGAVSGFGVGRTESFTGYRGIIAGNYGAAEYEALLGMYGPAQQQLKYVGVATIALALLIVGISAAEALRYRRERQVWRDRLRRQGRFGRSTDRDR